MCTRISATKGERDDVHSAFSFASGDGLSIFSVECIFGSGCVTDAIRTQGSYSMGEYPEPGLSLSRRSLVWEDEAG